MLSNIRFGKFIAPIVIFSLASFLVVQYRCEDANTIGKLLSEVLPDKETRDLVERYLQYVPSSHKSRAHAARLANASKVEPMGPQKLADSYPNNLGPIIEVLLKAKPECDQVCTPCPENNKCPSCPPPNCDKCAPCPVPSYCLPPRRDEKCPPKPDCPCDNQGKQKPILPADSLALVDSNNSTQNSSLTIADLEAIGTELLNGFKNDTKESKDEQTISYTSEIDKNGQCRCHCHCPHNRWTTTTSKPKPNSTTNRSPVTTNGPSKVTTTSGKPQTTKTPTTRSSEPSSSKKPTTTKPATNNPTTNKPTSKAQATTGKPTTTKPTTNEPTTKKPTAKAQATTGKPSTKKPTTEAPITKTPTTPSSESSRKPTSPKPKPPSTSESLAPATSSKPSSSPKPTSKASASPSTTSKPPTSSPPSSETTLVSKSSARPTSSNGSIIISMNSSSSRSDHIMSGLEMFDKYIGMFFSNNSMRENIFNILAETPENTGGEESRLAAQVLSKFGESNLLHTVKLNRKGNGRSYTYMVSRNNLKRVLGHLMDRRARETCKCPCEKESKCPACEVKSCSTTRKPGVLCPICPDNPACPAPKDCPEYPACPACKSINKTINVPDFEENGDPRELDDMDTINPLRTGELDRPKPCRGPTCRFQKTCGAATLNPLTPRGGKIGYMNGGQDQKYGEWPHFVRLKLKVPATSYEGICGGVLISNRHVLTAGHCVIKPPNLNGGRTTRLQPDSITVILGDNERGKKDQFEVQHGVSSICLSSKFSDPKGEGSRYDFSILTLDKNVTFNEYIQPACLPYKPVNFKTSKCFVVGMGVTKFNPTGQHEFAKKVQKMAVQRSSCKSWGIRNDDRSRHCFTKAKAKGDTCGGDSGGPIVCLCADKRWTVTGLVSYGSLACDGKESTGWVAVYSRITALIEQMQFDCKI